MAASGKRAVPIRDSGWTQGTVARQVEEWGGAHRTRVHRSERPASALFVELRGWDALVEHVGDAEARTLLERCVDRATQIARDGGSEEAIVSGPERRPVISATFEGERHATRALAAAVAIRDSVEQVQPSPLPGTGLEASGGVNTGFVVDVQLDEGEAASYLAVGTLRSFAVRLMEFAGPGDVFVSDETRQEVGDGAVTRSIGEMRINEWGERAEAFRLLDLVPAPAKPSNLARGFVPGLPVRAAPEGKLG